jgi:hypothetical protein
MAATPGHLVDQFHEIRQFGIYTRRPHPERRALARVSKGGGWLRRSFAILETHRLRDAPWDEVRKMPV